MLKAIDILVLSYADGLNVDKGLQQTFWRDQYAVSPNKILVELRKKGYIMVSEDLQKVLVTYTGKELQAAAVKYGVAKSGTKAEVSKRIIENVDNSQVIKDFPSQIYELTELGSEVLRENEYVVFVHKNSNQGSINLYDAEKVKERHHDYNGVQVISHLYNKAVKNEINQKNYNSATFEDLSHGNFLSREGMNEFALKYVLRAIYVRMSGLDRVIYQDSLEYGSYFDSESFVRYARVDSYMLSDLKKIMLAMDLEPKETVEFFENSIIKGTRLPAQILSDDEMKLVLLLELTENYREVEDIYRKVAKRPPIINSKKSTSAHKRNSTKQIASKKKPVKKSFLQKLLGK